MDASEASRPAHANTPLPLMDRGPTEVGHDYRQPCELREFPAGLYPSCTVHGALLAMTPKADDGTRIWRCDGCGSGVRY